MQFKIPRDEMKEKRVKNLLKILEFALKIQETAHVLRAAALVSTENTANFS